MRSILFSYKLIKLLIKNHEVISNTLFFVASEALRGRVKLEAVIIDPIGAILIAVYIIIAWILQAHSKCYLFSYEIIFKSNLHVQTRI